MSEPSDVAPSVPPLPEGQTAPATHEVAVDLAAFLPEGTELVADEPADPAEPADAVEALDPWDTGAPEPQVPAWALDDPPVAAPPAEAAPSADVAPEPEPVPPPAPDPSAEALERIDAELAAVDDALVALDAGTPERSPLLRELLDD